MPTVRAVAHDDLGTGPGWRFERDGEEFKRLIETADPGGKRSCDRIEVADVPAVVVECNGK